MSFAETLIPAMRAQLVRYARWDTSGMFEAKPDAWVAQRIRCLAPALADATDQQVLAAFVTLGDEVAAYDSMFSDPHVWLEPGEDLETERAALMLWIDATLLTLVPGEAP